MRVAVLLSHTWMNGDIYVWVCSSTSEDENREARHVSWSSAMARADSRNSSRLALSSLRCKAKLWKPQLSKKIAFHLNFPFPEAKEIAISNSELKLGMLLRWRRHWCAAAPSRNCHNTFQLHLPPERIMKSRGVGEEEDREAMSLFWGEDFESQMIQAFLIIVIDECCPRSFVVCSHCHHWIDFIE
jgi:hypothetical protein